jgi:peptide/nickel transport system substrate-binding protein
MTKTSLLFAAALTAAVSTGLSGFAQAAEIKIGLRDDPGSLDPATNATFTGRVVLQSACDKLVDIDPDGQLVPMLATSWEWAADGTAVTLKLRKGAVFQDGTPFNADAVKFNLDRYLTLEGSRRRAEISVIKDVAVVDDATVKLTLKSPSVSLLTQFTDRAGMMVSPTAYKATTPDAFAKKPTCIGPYSITEYKPQQNVVMAKFPGHWRADQYAFDKVTFSALTDSNVRLLNLKSGDLDLAEAIAPNDVPSIESDKALKVAVGAQPAYEMLMFNLTGPSANPDIAKSAAVREAFSLAIDRKAINDVVFGGRYDAGNQPFPPSSPWYDNDFPVPDRDVEAAKKKLAEAGVKDLKVDYTISTSPERQQVAEMMQAMLAEAGITLNILPTEFVAMRDKTAKGDFQAYVIGSSGRVDPDLNISLTLQCGTANNVGKYCSKELDDLLAKGRATADTAARKKIYSDAMAVIMKDVPGIYLYNPKAAYAMKAKLDGFKPFPDGIIRLEGVKFSQ